MLFEQHLEQILAQKMQNKALRSLKNLKGLSDFTSNDYLGFSNCQKLHEDIQKAAELITQNGAGGSRLLSGNLALMQNIESNLATFFNAPAALFFSSGYLANVGIYNALALKNDTIFYDELSHASTLDGIKLSKANAVSFLHNNLHDLNKQLAATKNGNKFISIEAVYSMDGDLAPLTDIVSIAQQHNAQIIIDEAHATGTIGAFGKGLTCHLQLEKHVLARIHTFGKALGTHGAVIVGSTTLQQYLINFCRTFIFTTAPAPVQFIAADLACKMLANSLLRITKLHKNIAYFNQLKNSYTFTHLFLSSNSPIQIIIIPNNEKVRNAAIFLQNCGFDVRPIISPTVPIGKERLRICIHSFNTFEEIQNLFTALNTFFYEQKHY